MQTSEGKKKIKMPNSTQKFAARFAALPTQSAGRASLIETLGSRLVNSGSLQAVDNAKKTLPIDNKIRHSVGSQQWTIQQTASASRI